MVENKLFAQSGVIPFRVERGEVYVLLITSRGGKNWIIPKGLVEENMTPLASAQKEALEEAGIEGEGYDLRVGTYEYTKWGGVCLVEVYPMTVQRSFAEWQENFRERKWFSCKDAAQKATRPGLRELLESFPDFLRRNGMME